MKLLRVGQKGSEKPAVLDNDGKIRDISSHVKDLNPDHLNFETISKLQSADLSSLPELSLSLIHISEPTRHAQISYAVFCLKKKTARPDRL